MQCFMQDVHEWFQPKVKHLWKLIEYEDLKQNRIKINEILSGNKFWTLWMKSCSNDMSKFIRLGNIKDKKV